jgi:hypothetical protein
VFLFPIFTVSTSTNCPKSLVFLINLYKLPKEVGFPHWDLLRLNDNFPTAIVAQFCLDSAQTYTPVQEWHGYDVMCHVTFARGRNHISKQGKVSPCEGQQGDFDAILHLVSNTQSQEIYSLYRYHILAPCKLLCSLDGAKTYLNCVICTN